MICSPIVNIKISALPPYPEEPIPDGTILYEGFFLLPEDYYLSTPNTQNSVYAQHISYVADPTAVINEINTEKDTRYYVAERISSANPLYNCHSYAWHSQDYDVNSFLIPDPQAYYSDGSYYPVTNPQVGDIICYMDDNGTPNNTSDDRNIHSGIIVYVIPNATSNGLCGNSDLFMVQSKWGLAGLYHHNGYQHPYTDYALTVNDTHAPEDNRAEYVRYYRRTGHTHNHSTCAIVEGNYDHHKCVCSCGQIIYEAHVWTFSPIRPMGSVTPNYIPQYTCRECGMITLRLS